ncbi:MAG TPA: DUF4337 family protein [Gemmataceae bacterium]|jgi:hypothetical protein|nr:DUF4337 family protein [Gemmataceae bacterium]
MSTTSSDDDAPKSAATKALAAVPVALTVLATILAGLSSSEMTRSMYYRSLAAQDQSKAGSQWAFFQAKRIRGTTLDATVDLVRTLTDTPPFEPGSLRSLAARIEDGLRAGASAAADKAKAARQKLDALLDRDDVKQVWDYLAGTRLPAIQERHIEDAAIADTLTAIRSHQTEPQTIDKVTRINPARLDEAIELAEANVDAFDEACKSATTVVRDLDGVVHEFAAAVRKAGSNGGDARAALKALTATVSAMRQDFTARRYAQEAKFNQQAAELYEVQVRRAGVDSERHRNRSKNFFYAMLCAQAGVTVASLALAKSRKSFFWAVAGAAGLLAIAMGGYVYLAM